MSWDFELLYHNSSIQEKRHVLRPNSCFLEFEASNKSNDIDNRCKPMIKNIQPPKYC